mmetsp:Transcript_47120/g.109824  ORF Transcript_47120/g.109824 Transcript_47120/m.109824 type:complete len:91 (-) Transcript_47120:81-353(-)
MQCLVLSSDHQVRMNRTGPQGLNAQLGRSKDHRPLGHVLCRLTFTESGPANNGPCKQTEQSTTQLQTALKSAALKEDLRRTAWSTFEEEV